jgi:hypothetical protein
MASEEKALVKLAQTREEHLRASMKRLIQVVPPEEGVRTFRCSPAAAAEYGADLPSLVGRICGLS